MALPSGSANGPFEVPEGRVMTWNRSIGVGSDLEGRTYRLRGQGSAPGPWPPSWFGWLDKCSVPEARTQRNCNDRSRCEATSRSGVYR